MLTVPAQSLCAPARARSIAALRSMPGVCGVFGSSEWPAITRTPSCFHLGSVIFLLRASCRSPLRRVRGSLLLAANITPMHRRRHDHEASIRHGHRCDGHRLWRIPCKQRGPDCPICWQQTLRTSNRRLAAALALPCSIRLAATGSAGALTSASPCAAPFKLLAAAAVLTRAIADDPRDTTSPAAVLSNLRTLVLGDALAPPSRERLTAWLVGNKTGDTRLRAGLPKDWRVGDKTGSGERGTTNDVGIVWPPGRALVFISIYLTGTPASPAQRNTTLAAVGRAVSSALD